MTSRQQPFTPDEFKRIYSQVPRLTVEVVVRTEQGVVLVQRQEKSWHGQWHIPGGTVLYRETLKEAVQRVVQEELGIEVNVGEMIGYIEYPSEEKERGFGWTVGIAFSCTPASAIPQDRWQAEKIQEFETLPENVIKEQVTILKKMIRLPQG